MDSTENLRSTEWPFGGGFPELGQGTGDSSALCPATITTSEHNIRAALPITSEILTKELYAGRLRQIQHLIWLAGRPLPPRPLHQQILLSRQLILSESIELHLIWKKGVFFVKPLPRYLLDRTFWDAHLQGNSSDNVDLAKCARGLIFSYTALVRHESDFIIAQEARLLPKAMTWPQWQQLVWSFLERYPGSEIYAHIDQRYYYGELRLGRLNKIYRLLPNSLPDTLYGYSNLTAHNLKSETFEDNLRLIGASFAYLVIVLQAMQIGLTTKILSASNAFQEACYGFAVFAIVAPLVALGTVAAVFLFLLVINVNSTLSFERQRFRSMDRIPPRLNEDREGKVSRVIQKA